MGLDSGTLWKVLIGEPRKILLLVSWEVGEDPSEQWRASLVISCSLMLVAVVIWLACAMACCDPRRVRQNRISLKAEREQRAPSGTSMAAADHLANLWTVHNKRYNLGPFVKAHPGGVDAILLGKGRNCTELFESYHSLSDERLVRKTLECYFVEDAPPGAPDHDVHFDWQSSPFYDALKLRVRAHFAENKYWNGHRAPLRQWVQLVGLTIVSVIVLSRFTQGSFTAMCLFPFCYWWGPSPCMHDGGHFSLSHRPWLNRLMAHIGGAHMSLFSWQYQHTVGHHVHTNIAGCDPDLYHFSLGAATGVPGFRTSLQLRPLPEQIGTLLRLLLFSHDLRTCVHVHLCCDRNTTSTCLFRHGVCVVIPL